jgi:hypothetical protein
MFLPLHVHQFLIAYRFPFVRIVVVDVARCSEFGVSNHNDENMRVYPEVSGLAAWNKNCKWYSFLLLSAVVSLFCESV